MLSYWYLNVEGEKVGPFSLEALKQQRIKENTMVWREGMHGWVKACDLYELVGFFTPLPGAPKKLTSQKKGFLILGALVGSAVALIVMRFLTPLFASFFGIKVFLEMTLILIGLMFVSGMVLAFSLKTKFIRIGTVVVTLAFITGYFFLMRGLFKWYGSFDEGFARIENSYDMGVTTGNYIVDSQGRIVTERCRHIYGINRFGIETTKSEYYYDYQQ